MLDNYEIDRFAVIHQIDVAPRAAMLNITDSAGIYPEKSNATCMIPS
jgi:hypothetical protein